MEDQFKKFVEDLERRQKEQNEKKKSLQEDEKNWQTRDLNKRYREKPGNRTTWGK
jgi:Skp family chaperone for outer membrane proteins